MWLQAIILGLVQGVTEFLPISSSAHLILVPKILHVTDQGLIVDVAAHLGSLIAVLIMYFPYLLSLGKSVIMVKSSETKKYQHLLILLVIATLPLVFFGYLLKDFISIYARFSVVIAIASFAGAILLFMANASQKKEKNLFDLTYKEAFIIGLWQVLALIPGMSRSASTIVGARFLGLDFKSSLDFSFLLSIPAILGAAILLMQDISIALFYSGAWLFTVVTFFSSFLSAMMVLFLFRKFIDKIGLNIFAFYRILLSLLIVGSLL